MLPARRGCSCLQLVSSRHQHGCSRRLSPANSELVAVFSSFTRPDAPSPSPPIQATLHPVPSPSRAFNARSTPLCLKRTPALLIPFHSIGPESKPSKHTEPPLPFLVKSPKLPNHTPPFFNCFHPRLPRAPTDPFQPTPSKSEPSIAAPTSFLFRVFDPHRGQSDPVLLFDENHHCKLTNLPLLLSRLSN